MVQKAEFYSGLSKIGSTCISHSNSPNCLNEKIWLHPFSVIFSVLWAYWPFENSAFLSKIVIYILISLIIQRILFIRRISFPGSNNACTVHEWVGSFQRENVRFKMTSVCGHVMGIDFVGKYFFIILLLQNLVLKTLFLLIYRKVQ